MNSANNNIQVLLAKYVENKTSNEESFAVLQALSASTELRWIFCMAVTGMSELQKTGCCSF